MEAFVFAEGFARLERARQGTPDRVPVTAQMHEFRGRRPCWTRSASCWPKKASSPVCAPWVTAQALPLAVVNWWGDSLYAPLEEFLQLKRRVCLDLIRARTRTWPASVRESSRASPGATASPWSSGSATCC